MRSCTVKGVDKQGKVRVSKRYSPVLRPRRWVALQLYTDRRDLKRVSDALSMGPAEARKLGAALIQMAGESEKGKA